MNLKNKLSRLSEDLEAAMEQTSWSVVRDSLHRVSIDEELFVYLCENPNIIDSLSSNRYWSWNWEYFVMHNMEVYPNSISVVLKNCSNTRLINAAMSSGVNSVSDYNFLAKSKNAPVREYAVSMCDFETLDTLSKDRSKKVRKLALSRLGPATHLDVMLRDKYADIRAMGVLYAPFAYPVLDELVGEISRQVFLPLVKKIRKESLPLLLI